MMKKVFSLVMSLVLAFGFLLLIPTSPARAAADTCTWTGTTSALWSVGTNWSGCDNAGVPEAGDALVFPAGASNLSMNNDLGVLTFTTVTITGNGYTFGGNDVNISSGWQFVGTGNTVTANINYINASSSSMTVSGGATGNVIDGNIDLNLTAGGDMNLNVGEDINHNGLISGSTDIFFQGVSTNSWITSTTQLSTFTAANSVNINSGYFQCRNDGCYGDSTNLVQTTGTGSLNFNDTAITITNDITLNSSASPQLNMQPGTVTLNGTLTVSSTGSIYAQPGTLVVGGLTTLSSDAYFLGSTATTSNILLNGNIDASSTGDVYIDNVFAGVSGNNVAYTGNFIAQAGSAIEAFSSDSLGDTTGTTTIESGATLYADSTITVDAEPITVSGVGVGAGNFTGAIVSNMNTREYTGPITLAGDTTFRTIANGDLTFSGSIGGTGNLQINTGGLTGEVAFSGTTANTYVGSTTSTDSNLGLYKTSGVESIPGDLYITSVAGDSQTLNNGGEQIADTAKVVFSQMGGPFDIASMQVAGTDTVGSIAGNGSVVIIAPQIFHVGNDNTSTTFSGIIYGGGTFDKVGTGALTLDGTNPGPVAPFTVSGGVLKVISDFSASSFTVNTGAFLKGTGQTGATTINTGGTLAAGTSPGCISAASLTLGAGSIFEEEIAGDIVCSGYDQTTVTGNASLGGATLNVLPMYTPTPGTVFTILQAGTISGTFNGLVDGATFTANGIQFRINYNTSTVANHTVTLTVLGGTLVPTGQNHNGVAYLAVLIMLLGSGGLYFALRRNKFSFKRIAL